MFAGTIYSGSQKNRRGEEKIEGQEMEKKKGKGKGESLAIHTERQDLLCKFEYQKAKNVFPSYRSISNNRIKGYLLNHINFQKLYIPYPFKANITKNK